MLSDFLIIIYSIVPVLIYSGIVFFSTPKGTIKLNHWFLYLYAGVLSALACLQFHKFFPDWQYTFMYKDHLSGIFWYCFITVALLEEGLKFILFKIFQFKENIIATTFGYCAVGAGFAIAENVVYGLSYGEPVLINRAFSAIVVHMALGIFAGYLIALGNVKNSVKEHSELDNLLNTSLKKKFFFNVLAIATVIFVHGLYDFNLVYQTEYTLLFHYVIMMGILLGARYTFLHISSLHSKGLLKE